VANIGYTPASFQSVTFATAGHGAGNGVASLYGVAGPKIYRIIESEVVAGSVSFVADSMLENPTGTMNTFPQTSSLTSVSYDSTLDRFLVSVASTTGRAYVTKYDTTGAQMD